MLHIPLPRQKKIYIAERCWREECLTCKKTNQYLENSFFDVVFTRCLQVNIRRDSCSALVKRTRVKWEQYERKPATGKSQGKGLGFELSAGYSPLLRSLHVSFLLLFISEFNTLIYIYTASLCRKLRELSKPQEKSYLNPLLDFMVGLAYLIQNITYE